MYIFARDRPVRVTEFCVAFAQSMSSCQRKPCVSSVTILYVNVPVSNTSPWVLPWKSKNRFSFHCFWAKKYYVTIAVSNINLLRSSRKVPGFISDFKLIWSLPTYFCRSTNYQILGNSFRWGPRWYLGRERQAETQTDWERWQI